MGFFQLLRDESACVKTRSQICGWLRFPRCQARKMCRTLRKTKKKEITSTLFQGACALSRGRENTDFAVRLSNGALLTPISFLRPPPRHVRAFLPRKRRFKMQRNTHFQPRVSSINAPSAAAPTPGGRCQEMFPEKCFWLFLEGALGWVMDT